MTEPIPLRLGDGRPFATGAATFFDTHPGVRERHPRVYVRFQLEGAPVPLLALIDTGAPYCILNEEAAKLFAGALSGDLGEVTIRSAYGPLRGGLSLHRLRLLAEVGESLEVNTIVFVPTGWRAPCFLGYTGLP